VVNLKIMNPYEPILKELAAGMLETAETKPNFSNDALLDATLIFQTVLIDKIFDCQDYDNMPMSHREEMATRAGENLRRFIHTFTGLDTVKLCEDYGRYRTTLSNPF
jgi:hypothetical protein